MPRTLGCPQFLFAPPLRAPPLRRHQDRSAKLSPNIGRPLFESARAASSWSTSQCSANTPSAMRTMSAAIQFLGSPVPEKRPCHDHTRLIFEGRGTGLDEV